MIIDEYLEDDEFSCSRCGYSWTATYAVRHLEVFVEATRGAELLVIGSHAHRGLLAILHDSVGGYCVRRAPCAVVVGDGFETRRTQGRRHGHRGASESHTASDM